MTAKEFFKSTSFKCIVTLLSILLVCGIFLTVMYALLQVTDGEKLKRSVKAIYGKEVAIYGTNDDGEEVVISSNEKDPKSKNIIKDTVKLDSAEVSEIYKVVYEENGADVINYLVTSKGNGGYGGGSVTCRVAVIVEDGNIAGINKVKVESNVGQSFIGKINDSFLNSFSSGYVEGIYYNTGDGFLSSGATMSSNAINNAVNGAIECVDTAVLGHTNVDPYEEFEYTSHINKRLTTYTVDGDKVKLTIVTAPKGEAGAFTIEITVKADKTIESFEITTDGSTGGWGANMYPKTNYIGKDVEFFKSALKLSDGEARNDTIDKNVINAGATHSSFLCVYAGAFATANYDRCIAQGGVN